uniref:Uncharacterized protein n=1 Tax=Sinocyclocheilus grahami TaxID=75366 RepID=A0A672S2H6_SINGR
PPAQQRTELHLKTARLMAGSSLSHFTGKLHQSQKQLGIQERLFTPDNLAKVQKDRQFLSDVINGLMVNLQKKNNFQSLFSVVEEQRKKKAQLLDIIKGRLRFTALQKELLDIHKKQNYPYAYYINHTLLMAMKFETKCALLDSILYSGIYKPLPESLININGVLFALMQILCNSLLSLNYLCQKKNLQEKLQFWIQQYEKEMEKKEQEITALQNKRNINKARIQELSKKCRDMQEDIIEDRMEKERLRAQLEKEQRDRDAAIKVKCHFRDSRKSRSQENGYEKICRFIT